MMSLLMWMSWRFAKPLLIAGALILLAAYFGNYVREAGGTVLGAVSHQGSTRGATGQAVTQPRRDYSTVNVCQLVPGERIARALGGTLSEARPFGDKAFSRCTYLLRLATNKPAGYVVWIQPAEDFEDLKQGIDEPLTTVSGLGDGAYMFHDQGDGRFKINVLKRGDLMFQATGESAESARKVADTVVTELWKRQ